MKYLALLHDKNRRGCLYRDPDVHHSSLNCGRANEFSDRIVKIPVDSGDSFAELVSRVVDRFLPYLAPSEVVKIYDETGCELKRISPLTFKQTTLRQQLTT